MAGLTTGAQNTGIGNYSGYYNQTGSYNTLVGLGSGYGVSGNSYSNNTMIGYQTGYSTTTGGNNFFGGYQAGYSNTSGIYNTFVGQSSGYNNTTARDNTALGINSSLYNQTGLSNVAIGAYALQGVSGQSHSGNVAIGYSAGHGITIGGYNLFGGYNSGRSNTSGSSNVGLGTNALWNNLTGNYNVGIGYESLNGVSGQSHSNNTMIGYQTGYSTTTGGNNFFGGYQAGYLNQTGTGIVAVGYQAGYSNTANSLVAIGYQAGYNNTIGHENYFSGYQAGYSNTTGFINTFSGYKSGYLNLSGSYNTALGNASLYSNTTGGNNTAIGFNTLYQNSTGSGNTAVGWDSLGDSISSSSNTGVGSESLRRNITGNSNTALGNGAIGWNTSGSSNIAVGVNSLHYGDGGDNNIILGNSAGYFLTGDNNVFIGHQAGGSSSVTSGTGNVFLGYQAGYSETGSNKLYIDNSNTATPLIGGDFSSDALTVNGTLNVTNTLTVTGNILPSANDTYSLGSDTMRWANAWLGAETIHVGTADADEGEIGYDTTNNVMTVQSNGNLSLQASGGNVGIGTTSPGSKISITGGGAYFASGLAAPTGVSVSPTSGGTLTAGTNRYVVVSYDSNGLSSGRSLEVACVVNGSTTNACQISWNSVYGAVSYRVFGRVGTEQNQYWQTSSTTFTDIGNAGNSYYVPPSATSAYFDGTVGIGAVPDNPNPYLNTKLKIAGGIVHANNSNIWLTGTSGVGYAYGMNGLGLYGGSSGGGMYLSNGPFSVSTDNGYFSLAHMGQFSTSKDSYLAVNSGNVGIGTTAPGSKLTVAGTTLFQNASNAVNSYQFNNATGTSVMSIDTTNGLVGIGTTSPSSWSKLNVLGKVVIGTPSWPSGSTNSLHIVQSDGGSMIALDSSGSVSNAIVFTQGGNDRAKIQSSMDGSYHGGLSFWGGSYISTPQLSLRGGAYSSSVAINKNVSSSGYIHSNTFSVDSPANFDSTTTTTANNSTTIVVPSHGPWGNLALGDRVSLSSAPSTWATVTGFGSAGTFYVSNPLGDGTTQNINVERAIARFSSSSDVTRMLIQGGGNVGIGSLSPDRRLDVLDASAPQLRLTHTDGSVYTDLQTTSAGNLYINPSGENVGIGTTSPSQLLDINGSLAISGSARRIIGDFSSSPLGNRTMLQSSVTNGDTLVYNLPNGISKTAGWLSIGGSDPVNADIGGIGMNSFGQNNALSIGTSYNGSGSARPVYVAPNSTFSTAFLTNGNVGIGTTNPGQKLDVVGNGIFSTSSTYQSDAYKVTNAGTDYGGFDRPQLTISSQPSSYAQLLIKGGNGINQYTPNMSFANKNNAGNYILGAALSVTSPSTVAGAEVQDLSFFTQSGGTAITEKMRIQGGGNVGIGTTAPATNLHVRSSTAGGSATPIETFRIDAYNPTNTNVVSGKMNFYTTNTAGTFSTGGIAGINSVSNGGDLAFYSTPSSGSSTEYMRLTNGGRLGIGTTDPGTAKLSVQGGGIVVGSPTGGDKGAGTINATAVYDDNVLLTDYVFDKYFDGVVKVEDQPLHSNYNMLSLDEMGSYIQNFRHLPTIPGRDDWQANGKFSLGVLANHLWETAETQALYVVELNSKVSDLNGKWIMENGENEIGLLKSRVEELENFQFSISNSPARGGSPVATNSNENANQNDNTSESSDMSDSSYTSNSNLNSNDNVETQIETKLALLGISDLGESLTGFLREVWFSAKVTFEKTVAFMSEVTFGGKVKFEKPVELSGDSVGEISIAEGEKKVEVKFENTYDKKPVVTVTPVGIVDCKWGVDNVTEEGFEIVIDPIQNQEIKFNWHAFSGQKQAIFEEEETQNQNENQNTNSNENQNENLNLNLNLNLNSNSNDNLEETAE